MGTFDGVHLGHQAILAKTVAEARRRGCPSLAVTFSFPPRLFFYPQPGAHLLNTLTEKKDCLHRYGLDRVVVLPFNKALANMSANRFFKEMIQDRFRARDIFVGYDFGFGKGRQGDSRFLKKRGDAAGINVHIVPPVCRGRVPISSEQIRCFLREGRLAEAQSRLGQPYRMGGVVRKGRGRGTLLGFPTANVKTPPEKILPPGVFAVWLRTGLNVPKPGMCNIGSNPTFEKPPKPLGLEVHVLGGRQSLAGKKVSVEIVEKLREERKFLSAAALVRQLRKDKRFAQRILKKSSPQW